MIGVAIVVALVGVALAYVVQPLLKGPLRETVDTPRVVQQAEERKRAAILAILDLEEENQVGKLSDADLATLRAEYETAALQALRELEELGVVARSESDDVEAEIERVKAQLLCPRCGAIRKPSEACPACGSS